MKTINLNDSLNLRDLIEQITDYARANNLEPKNARSFLLLLFHGIKASDLAVARRKTNNDNSGPAPDREDVNDNALLLYLQKLLSGNIPIESLPALTASVLDEQILNVLYDNISPIIEVFSHTPDCFSFFLRLSQQISPRFFRPEEISILKASLYDCDYHRFLFDLVVHGIKTLNNIPAYFCERLESEALTYDYDSPVRYELLRIASTANKRAALEYGNYLAKNGPYDQAFKYMLNALPMPAAIWNIAFLIETHKLTQNEIKQFKNAIRYEEKVSVESLSAFPELADIICVVKVPEYDDLVCAFKTYAYLASKCIFYKGYNSMAKLLGTTAFALQPGSIYTKERLIAEYSRRAIEGATPTALNNSGAALLEKLESGSITDDGYEHELLLECLQCASSCGMANAAFRLAHYFEYSSSASREEIMTQYRRAIELDVDKTKIHGLSYLSLGELEQRPSLKREYYEKAADHGNASAILNLAIDYAGQMAQSDQPDYWLSELYSLAGKYDKIMTEGIRDKVMKIIRESAERYGSRPNYAAMPSLH